MKHVAVFLSLSLFVACFSSSARAQTSTIALVQRANKDAGTATSATLAFNSSNTGGNWIGVCVRAGNSGQILTVSDSRGNTYRRAVQYNVTADTPNGHTLGIFYAENIAGGANAITVSGTISGTMRIAIVEYSGVAATNSLDVFAAAQGNGVSPNSGNATTTSSGDLLLGAISSANSASFTAGNGFVIEGSVPAAPNTKLAAEDRIQTAAGTVSAGATFGAPDNWGAALAAFKAGNAGGGSPPSITSLNPASSVVGTSVTISGANFGATQGTSTVKFNGVAATPASWSATSIVAPVPAGATTGNVVVTVGGVASNGMNFAVTPPPPSITSLNPASGVVGTSVTISGANFGAAQGASAVTFNGTAGTPASWSATSIVVPVPSGAATGNVVITRAPSGGGSAEDISNGVNFTVTSSAPSITSLNPTSGAVGTSVTISGTNLGTTQGTSTVTFNGKPGTPTSWSATGIVVPVPSGTTTGNVLVTVGGIASNGVNFTVPPVTSGIAVVQRASQDAGTTTTASVAFKVANTAGNFIAVCIRAGRSGQVFTVRDSNGNAYRQGVQFNVTADAPNGDTLGIFYAENIKGGANTITVSNTILGTLRFVILEYSGIATANSLDTTAAGQGTSASPNSANAATTSNGELLLSAILSANPATFTAGSGFAIEGSVPAAPNAKLIVEDRIQTVAGTVSAGASLGAPDSWGVVLAAFKPGNTGGGGPPPSITSLNPTSGVIGTSLTISGANFGATQGSSTVKFNGTAATPSSWSAASIVAPVPAGATTGNVVVAVGGAASNGVSFTVQSDTTPPLVTITSPASNSTVSGAITLTATATDPDSTVSFVQFQADSANRGAQLTTAPYSLSVDSTTLSNGTHTLTAVAQDPAGNQGTSAAVTITVSNSTGLGATGPLRALASNPRYFTDGSGKAILLTGSQTWDTFQDMDQGSSPAAFDFTAYVNFLKSHGHNVTILWRKDLPTYCNWGAGGTWHVKQFPWKRTGGSSGTQVASDGLPAFDLTQLDQTYFDRLRARVIQLQQNGVYAIVELFDGLGLLNNRCSNDGYPFTGGNNVNGVDDGGGTNSMTMGSPNTITNYQDAFVQKVIDTVNDQPNVLWEISEEAPGNSTWWQGHMISLIHTYEASKPAQHPVGFPYVTGASDSLLYNSNAEWVAPGARISPTSSCGSGTPACKVNINDSDHSYFGMWNDSAQTNRNYVWENFTHGDSVMFMDPYVIYWPSGNRNLCPSPSNGVCSGPDSRWNNMRDNLGYTLTYANKMDLAKMTPQGNLSSTGFCLADNVATGAEYLVYAPSGGSFTVNLSATTRTLNVEWLNPSSGAITTGGTIAGGSANQSFTPPFSGDAVLYLVDIAGHN